MRLKKVDIKKTNKQTNKKRIPSIVNPFEVEISVKASLFVSRPTSMVFGVSAFLSVIWVDKTLVLLDESFLADSSILDDTSVLRIVSVLEGMSMLGNSSTLGDLSLFAETSMLFVDVGGNGLSTSYDFLMFIHLSNTEVSGSSGLCDAPVLVDSSVIDETSSLCADEGRDELSKLYPMLNKDVDEVSVLSNASVLVDPYVVDAISALCVDVDWIDLSVLYDSQMLNEMVDKVLVLSDVSVLVDLSVVDGTSVLDVYVGRDELSAFKVMVLYESPMFNEAVGEASAMSNALVIWEMLVRIELLILGVVDKSMLGENLVLGERWFVVAGVASFPGRASRYSAL